MIQATQSQGRIWIRSEFELKDAIKALPGATWGKAERRWHIPATPNAAGALRALAHVSGGVEADEGVRSLFDMHATATQAQEFKTCVIELVPTVATKTEQWDHQKRGTAFALSMVSTLLAWGMGAGKTKTTIDIMNGAGADLALVLCPKAVIDVWPTELDKHSVRPFDVLTLTKGTTAKKAADLAHFVRHAQPGVLRVVVVNYESAWRDALAKEILKQAWDFLVLDEIHRIKSPGGKSSKFCARLRPKAKRVLGLSGTVMPHSPADLYGSFRALDPGIFGTSFTKFRARYCVMGGFNAKQIVEFQNLDELSQRMGLISYEVSRDLLDLPPETDADRFVELSTEELKFYNEIKKNLCAELDAGEVTAKNALVKLLKLQQATGGFAVTDDGKIVEIGKSRRAALADALQDLAPGEPVVVFCKFRQDLDSVHAVAAELKRGSLELSGRVNQLKEWQASDDAPPILVTQIQAGGIGVDLTRAAVAVYYSVGYSLGDVLQARARIHRPGQARNVVNIHLIARGTVDVAIRRALEKKEDLINSVLESIRK